MSVWSAKERTDTMGAQNITTNMWQPNSSAQTTIKCVNATKYESVEKFDQKFKGDAHRLAQDLVCISCLKPMHINTSDPTRSSAFQFWIK